MRGRSQSIASALVAGGLLCLTAVVQAQKPAASPEPVGRVAALAPGAILGLVLDEKGAPVAGATVSAFGASTTFATTDRLGRFEMRTLSPGPYLVRAHLAGYVTSHGQIVDVRPSGRTSSSIALRHSAPPSSSSYAIVPASMGGTATATTAQPGDATTGTTGSLPAPTDDDHGETAWRLRHVRRGILKDATVPADVFRDDSPAPNGFGPAIFGAVESPARAATNFFSATPFSGQFNLLTTTNFDSPQQLLTSDSLGAGVAFVALSAPVGEHADWTVRGAMTQGNVASWIIAGEYVTRAPARHQYDVGLSYATQRYDGDPLALQPLTDGSRNAGAVFGYDTFTITPAISVSYGARYSHYDYLQTRSLISPRAGVTFTPASHLRVNAMVSERATAPGAEEFLPPSDGDVLLPPERTFSALNPTTPLRAERTTSAEVTAERDIAGTTISARVFRQYVVDQLVTVFGAEMPGQAIPEMGHYFLGNTGDVQATGFGAGFRTSIGDHVHGSIEYTETSAQWQPTSEAAYLIVLVPSALGLEAQRIHDVTTAVETELPRTLTKVMLLCRVSNGFSHPYSPQGAENGPALDTRFDLQIRQSLPFMDFSAAKWEMLVGVRNFFRDPAIDQSIYDELLVVRPPKRIVGGLTLHF